MSLIKRRHFLVYIGFSELRDKYGKIFALYKYPGLAFSSSEEYKKIEELTPELGEETVKIKAYTEDSNFKDEPVYHL